MCKKCKKKKLGSASGTGRVCGHRTTKSGLKYCAKCARDHKCCPCCGRADKSKKSSR